MLVTVCVTSFEETKKEYSTLYPVFNDIARVLSYEEEATLFTTVSILEYEVK